MDDLSLTLLRGAAPPTAAQARLREAYARALAGIIVADGEVQPHELLKLYAVYALFDAREEVRLAGLDALVFDPEGLRSAPLPTELLADPALRALLARDALVLQQGAAAPETRTAVARLLEQIRLTAAQIDVLSKWVKLENEVLRRAGAGEEWLADEASMGELTSRAAAVGLPVAVLYSAGLTGLSAAGVTSGLASIGAVTGLTLLGLNPMTAGVAGLLLAGVAVKRVADYALGNGPAAKVKALREELALVRAVHVRAASRLATDLATWPGRADDSADHGADRAARRLAFADTMRAALALLEDGGGETELVKR